VLRVTAFFLSLIAAVGLVAQDEARTHHTLSGEIHSIRSFHSTILNNDRDVLIYLPPGYDKEPQRRYPVLYMHDGQNVFDGATAYAAGHEWRADETAQALIASGKIEPIIIVAVNNVGTGRINEYTPTAVREGEIEAMMKGSAYDPAKDKSDKRVGGGADLYGRMLIEELKPRIDREFRTLVDAGHTGIAGSSLGALVSMHIALTHPEVFGRAVAMSTTVIWDKEEILREIGNYTGMQHARLWIDAGELEQGNIPEGVHQLCNALAARGWKQGDDLHCKVYPEARHNEDSWAARFGDVLVWLYRNNEPPIN
jgi:predicted alpha/beta superfamily hydrolase